MNFETKDSQLTGRRRTLVEALASPSNTLEKHSTKRVKKLSPGPVTLKPFKTEEVEENSTIESIEDSAGKSFLDRAQQPSEMLPPRTPEKYGSPFSASPPIAKHRPIKLANPPPLKSNENELQDVTSLHEIRGKSCIFNDPIHGNITMNGLCLRIIDTREFQRLRYLKQLGTCDYVYHGATHSRFSHSIGVAYYSELVLKNLKQNQPYLDITPVDILCVKVAGLCHDLGHGAYSHVWEVFMKKVEPKITWHHEESSVEMFQLLIRNNNISLSKYGLTAQDELFITEIIRGTEEAERKGRTPEKYFLYDIVNNKRSGLDVDKLDYFLRDIKHTNVNVNSVSFDRFFQLGRVLKAEPIRGSRYKVSSMSLNASSPIPIENNAEDDSSNNMYTICYPEKMVGEAVNLFGMRFHLHQKVYTHKTVKKVEYMKADPFIKIPGSISEDHPDGLYRLSECVFDITALSNLNDNIIYLIETSALPELKPAQDLLLRMRNRQFYDCLGKAMYKRNSKLDSMSVEVIAKSLVDITNKYIQELREKSGTVLKRADTDASIDRFPSVPMSYQSVESAYGQCGENGIPYEDDLIQSQDSFQPWLKNFVNQYSTNIQSINRSSFLNPVETVSVDDIIVEKMHIHYGLKDENPVNRLRFFSKESEEIISDRWDENVKAVQIKEQQYETLLPRVFEETSVRIFCRYSEKSPYFAEAFKRFSVVVNSELPFPSLSLSQC